MMFQMLWSTSNDNATSDDNGLGNGNVVLSKIEISNATNLFIAPASSVSGRSARNLSGNKLFKITGDGYVQEVTYIYEDDDGNPTTSTETLSPTSIVVLNTDYLIVSFGYNNSYLVNSNTGACYIYTNDLPNIAQGNSYWRESIGEDSNGNCQRPVEMSPICVQQKCLPVKPPFGFFGLVYS